MESNTKNQYQHYALDINNNIIEISNTNDLEVHQYYCPYCHKEMIAKRGNIRQWHFAHKTDKCSYDKYLHSIAEIMIMDWFNKSENIFLTMQHDVKCNAFDSCLFYNSMYCQASEKRPYDLKKYYSKCIHEIKYEGYIADLYCENNIKPNSPIFIEIFVTHKCSQDKINSGIRIIELKIESEEDIINILNSNKLEEGEKVKLYNFKPKEILVDYLKQDFQKYILYPSLKTYVNSSINCRNYAKYRKGIYEISLPYYYCKSNFYINKFGGIFTIGTVKAYLDGKIQKDCRICRWQKETIGEGRICKLYKKCKKPRFCKYNDASICLEFKENTDLINHTKTDLDIYLERGHIDIWEAEK